MWFGLIKHEDVRHRISDTVCTHVWTETGNWWSLTGHILHDDLTSKWANDSNASYANFSNTWNVPCFKVQCRHNQLVKCHKCTPCKMFVTSGGRAPHSCIGVCDVKQWLWKCPRIMKIWLQCINVIRSTAKHDHFQCQFLLILQPLMTCDNADNFPNHQDVIHSSNSIWMNLLRHAFLKNIIDNVVKHTHSFNHESKNDQTMHCNNHYSPFDTDLDTLIHR